MKNYLKLGIMDVEFKTNRLKKCYENHREAVRKYGKVVGLNYIACIDLIYSVNDVNELYAFPQYYFHPLREDREGQYALELTGRMRLIVTLKGDELQIVRIEEVSKHYE
ncbi:MAG: plasmid maintenance system killer [Candidatus Aquicultor secundus]|uniref:Plasmid maintenance system killer n=2 Tax=Candidatus Aquicultor secundus TaxID=1973895 RepID=A0A2M7T679_9ACTN|nr:MAG: plasmid maintenance system killer [Candidatus Aquicultor secundus]PIW22347.1 MAG: plasmid maintenance system killer [Candidatus Aquicultor secundus]PIX51233.1 MAG: plasmid maintenance system killer [Candidatus Aquicultor secundus]PIY37644.1 MAG: plasmid maintenance system killer [Candidatus Aquicultor secundus]PIZ36329.1 MAG: plasmid maintenance system killer [Candidatus Aquicultor secundus]